MSVSIRGFQFFHIWAIISKFGKLTVEKLTEHDGSTASRNGQLHMWTYNSLCFLEVSYVLIKDLEGSLYRCFQLSLSRKGNVLGMDLVTTQWAKVFFFNILIMHETRHARTQSNIGWSSKNSFRVFVEVWCLKYSLVYFFTCHSLLLNHIIGETER